MSEHRVTKCEACGRPNMRLRQVGSVATGDYKAQVCADAVACQRTIVAAKRLKQT